jgi:hypothetical protein
MNSTVRRTALAAALTVAALGVATPASAHPHVAAKAHGGTGQVLANGQNHATPQAGFTLICSTSPDGKTSAPAVYGLETAHHGPDAGTPGKSDDGCYQNESDVRQPTADVNPGIN